mgnify:CR=1 FL=1
MSSVMPGDQTNTPAALITQDGTPTIASTNDWVVKFANVNGTGSASANHMFAKAIFRMGIPVSPKNIFPSNIQGLPTWYEVRVSEQGYLGRREGIDMMVCVNPQSMAHDAAEVLPGGYFVYDNSKPLDLRLQRSDIHYIGIPLSDICLREYRDPRQRQLFKNVIYVGALAALLEMEFSVLKDLVADQFKGKEKLVAPNIHGLELGYQYAANHYACPLPIRLQRRDLVGDQVLLTGNTATALGCIYGGATVAAWYPITPSTSIVDAYEKYAKRLRIDPGSGKKNYAIAQAEDELSALGIVIGASWNGARAFTATSGPGISLMSEFLGLAYFAEIPAVVIDVQRAGPSTGMPTRTQQSDLLSCAYASHGDTKHLLLLPSSPKECFDFTAGAFDLAEQLQTPILVMSDLDLGMNDHMSPPLEWNDARRYDRGKVLSGEELDKMREYGRYLDPDNDGIGYRTYPGTHPQKGAYFTRGSSHDAFARYTEDCTAYVKNMERLLRKFDTAKEYLPAPVQHKASTRTDYGIIYFGTSAAAAEEAIDQLTREGLPFDGLRIRAFPFHNQVTTFIESHPHLWVVDQNRDGQMRTLLINELDIAPNALMSIKHFDGLPITAQHIYQRIREHTPTVADAVIRPRRSQTLRAGGP